MFCCDLSRPLLLWCCIHYHRSGRNQRESGMNLGRGFCSFWPWNQTCFILFPCPEFFFRGLGSGLLCICLCHWVGWYGRSFLGRGWHFLNEGKYTELEESVWSFGIEHGRPSTFMFGYTVSASGGHPFWILIPTSPWIYILRVNGHRSIDVWQSLSHGVG